MRSMPAPALDHQHRSLAPLIAVATAAMVFAVLLVLVRLRWAPLESADHGAAAGINGLIAGDATLVAVVKAVTCLGSDGVLWTVTGAAAVVLALRRQSRLAVYLLVTGAGALVLDPVLKSLVGRLRPVVAHPVAHGTGTAYRAATRSARSSATGRCFSCSCPRPAAGGAPRSSP
jgi:undecaprenyl-diphosphatase